MDFDSLIKKSYNFNQYDFDHDPKWSVLRDLYNKNFIEEQDRGTDVMPKKIHQIWFGDKMPERYVEMTKTWKTLNPEWEYKLWTEKDIRDVPIYRKRLFDTITHPGQKSDFLRYHILNHYGGIYVDTDFECLKPFDPLCYANFITGIGYPSKVELYIGLIGSVPHHPIMELVIKNMVRANSCGWKNIFETTGTYFFTRQFFRVVDSNTKGILALPPDYFYPLPNYVRKDQDADRTKFIQECSLAIHHWACSWTKKKKDV